MATPSTNSGNLGSSAANVSNNFDSADTPGPLKGKRAPRNRQRQKQNAKQNQSQNQGHNSSTANTSTGNSDAQHVSSSNKSKSRGKKKEKAKNTSGNNKENLTQTLETQDGKNITRKSPPDFRLQEITSLINKFPPSQINGKEFQPSHKRAMINFVKTTLVTEDVYLVINVIPSDPEFPFDLESLKISLLVPLNYPMKKNKNGVPNNRPSMMVLNSEIPRGISYNIESGFKKIVEKSCGKKEAREKGKISESNSEKSLEEEIKIVGGNNLVGIIQTLDKYLEVFLSQKKKDTIKFVRQRNAATAAATIAAAEENDNNAAPERFNDLDPALTAANEATSADIKKLNDNLGNIAYRLNRQHEKTFTYQHDYYGVGYIYHFALQNLEGIAQSFQNQKNNFNITNVIRLLLDEFSIQDTVVKIFVPLDVKNNAIRIELFDLKSSAVKYANNSTEMPSLVQIKEDNHVLCLQQFLHNMKLNFNNKSKLLHQENKESYSILFLLNYLNSKFFQLGVQDDLL